MKELTQLETLIIQLVALTENDTQLGAVDLITFAKDNADRMKALVEDVHNEISRPYPVKVRESA